jgi:hypothetical protein
MEFSLKVSFIPDVSSTSSLTVLHFWLKRLLRMAALLPSALLSVYAALISLFTLSPFSAAVSAAQRAHSLIDYLIITP